MNNDPVYTRFREILWRRKLTGAEQSELDAWLAAHPEARMEWELESALSHRLAEMADAPVPSNFTARVVQAAHRKAAGREGRSAPGWRVAWNRLVPRVALALVLAVVGLAGYVHFEAAAQRAKFAHKLQSNVAAAPSADVLMDFETIRKLRFDEPQAPDEKLLAIMQ